MILLHFIAVVIDLTFHLTGRHYSGMEIWARSQHLWACSCPCWAYSACCLISLSGRQTFFCFHGPHNKSKSLCFLSTTTFIVLHNNKRIYFPRIVLVLKEQYREWILSSLQALVFFRAHAILEIEVFRRFHKILCFTLCIRIRRFGTWELFNVYKPWQITRQL